MTITDLLTPEARATLPPALQLHAWLGAHGLDLRAFAHQLADDTISPSSAYSGLHRLFSGTRREPTMRARIEAATGISSEAWEVR